MALKGAVQSASKVATKYTGGETCTGESKSKIKEMHYILIPHIFGIFLMRIREKNVALTP